MFLHFRVGPSTLIAENASRDVLMLRPFLFNLRVSQGFLQTFVGNRGNISKFEQKYLRVIVIHFDNVNVTRREVFSIFKAYKVFFISCFRVFNSKNSEKYDFNQLIQLAASKYSHILYKLCEHVLMWSDAELSTVYSNILRNRKS